MKNKKRLRTILIIAAVLVIAAAAAGGVYVLRVKAISISGVTLTPSRDYDIHEVTYYLQNDPEWAGDPIGNSAKTLGSSGCLISCAASAITDMGVALTPAELNEKLTGVGGFSGADLIWYKIHEAVPEVDYTYSRTFSAETIENDLRAGRLPIVNVRYYGGATHWVLIIGAQNGEFMIYDPLNKDKTPIPLSTHGKVYSYRVLVKQ